MIIMNCLHNLRYRSFKQHATIDLYSFLQQKVENCFLNMVIIIKYLYCIETSQVILKEYSDIIFVLMSSLNNSHTDSLFSEEKRG